MIPFNRPPRTGKEEQYVLEAMASPKISGNGPFAGKCEEWFEQRLSARRAVLTPSCTHALEMAAILLDIAPGDEVIMPSFTFVSTANAFAMRGATIVFVDVDRRTMNVDPELVEAAVTPRTKAIVPVHYAGVPCEMDALMRIADDHGLFVVEDAAQAMGSAYRGQPLGTIGHLGAFSFHETKNYTSGGEGGLLVVNDPAFVERAEVIREKGTNRSAFFRGQVDKYTWVDLGSSYLPSELQAAYLWGQLQDFDRIRDDRRDTWRHYREALIELERDGLLELPHLPEDESHNAHMFAVRLADLEERGRFIEHLARHDVMAVFHYVPLHSAPAGKRLGRFEGADRYTTRESERIVRLPLWFGMSDHERARVVEAVFDFFGLQTSGVTDTRTSTTR